MKKNPKADNTNCTRDRNDDFDLETAGERTRAKRKSNNNFNSLPIKN